MYFVLFLNFFWNFKWVYTIIVLQISYFSFEISNTLRKNSSVSAKHFKSSVPDSGISHPPLPFPFLLSSFTSIPALAIWPHNLIFSSQSVYLILLATFPHPASPCLSPLSVSIFELYPFIPYLLHPLQSSSVFEFFTTTPAVYRGRASEEPVSRLCNLGIVESEGARRGA